MISLIKRGAEKFITSLIDVVRNLLTLLTFFSFPVLFVLFFIYLFKGEVYSSALCVLGICAFAYLNKNL